jgi:hypothetical protein
MNFERAPACGRIRMSKKSSDEAGFGNHFGHSRSPVTGITRKARIRQNLFAF